MEPTRLQLLTLLCAGGVAAQWLASRLRLPPLLLLLATGLVLGPVTGLVDPAGDFGDLLHPVVSLAVALVLFEGGLSLHLDEARHVGPTLWRLIASGLVLGFGFTTVIATTVGGLSLGTSATLGAVLVVTGPTVILPMLRSARIALRPSALLKWEGIVNDPLGVLLAVFVLDVVLLLGPRAETPALGALALTFLVQIAAAGTVGTAAGLWLGKALAAGWIAEHLRSPVILAAVLVVFTLCDTIHPESGLLAVTLMGILLAHRHDASIHDVQRFKEQITTLLVALLFVVLSADLDPGKLELLVGGPLLVVFAVLFLVRPCVVGIATLGTSIPLRERALVGWIAPRGVVAAAMAGAFGDRLVEEGYPDGELLVPIVFGVIVATVSLHGLTIRPMARRLGLAAVEGNGILIVGASRWAVDLALALEKAGAYAVLADNRFHRVSRARMEGLAVHYGDVLHEDLLMELPMERVTWVLAATDEDSYNALVCLHFTPELGREHTLRVTPAPRTGESSGKEGRQKVQARTPWGPGGSHDGITRRFWEGGTFKVTAITESYTWEDLRRNQPDALPLFQIHQGRLAPLEQGAAPTTGARVILLS